MGGKFFTDEELAELRQLYNSMTAARTALQDLTKRAEVRVGTKTIKVEKRDKNYYTADPTWMGGSPLIGQGKTSSEAIGFPTFQSSTLNN